MLYKSASEHQLQIESGQLRNDQLETCYESKERGSYKTNDSLLRKAASNLKSKVTGQITTHDDRGHVGVLDEIARHSNNDNWKWSPEAYYYGNNPLRHWAKWKNE